MRENVVYDKAVDFSVRIVNLYKFLVDSKSEYVMSKQLLRSGTSIGANISESVSAESSSDFIHKLEISQKEAEETLYWLLLLFSWIFYVSFNQLNGQLFSFMNVLNYDNKIYSISSINDIQQIVLALTQLIYSIVLLVLNQYPWYFIPISNITSTIFLLHFLYNLCL